jgi:hypothetical protein
MSPQQTIAHYRITPSSAKAVWAKVEARGNVVA